jgi:nucleotide-binding universal stress UspA family protein
MYKHILIPTDGSATAAKAIASGLEFARETKARVTLFTAVPEYQVPSESDVMARKVLPLWEHERISGEKAEAVLGPAAQQLRAAGVQCETAFAQSDHPYQAIVEAAERHGCDLILMSSHGRHGLAGLWHGSETNEVLTHSSIPTLVYR